MVARVRKRKNAFELLHGEWWKMQVERLKFIPEDGILLVW